ncbi:MAG: phospholipid carrier-dependent glycosyltransferase [Lachnospiraceae bacterium]|nr:phospholipid carrier-dependent glycosyltransferase [Lachnospiraceae bacterium]
MFIIHLFAAITVLGLLYGIHRLRSISGTVCRRDVVFAVLFGGFLIRCLFAIFYQPLSEDTYYFADMTYLAFDNKLSEFYASTVAESFSPGITYILWILGCIYTVTGIPYLSGIFLLLLKLPAILCDLAAGYLLYKACLKVTGESRALLFSALYLFNPVILLNSSVWGQMDAIYTLAAAAMCLFLTEKKLAQATAIFGLGFFFSPLMIWFLPLLLIGLLDQVVLHDFSIRKLGYHLSVALCTVSCVLLASIPLDLNQVFSRYKSQLFSQNFAAVNAFNLWGLLGQNWISQDTVPLLLSIRQLGLLISLLIAAAAVFMFFKLSGIRGRYFLTGAFLTISMFLFSTGVHERYLYPAVLLLLFAYLEQPFRELYVCYIGFSLLHLYNLGYSLFIYDYQNYNRRAVVIVFFSGALLIAGCYFYRLFYRLLIKPSAQFPIPKFDFYSLWQKDSVQASKSGISYAPQPSAKKMSFILMDILIILVITLGYSFFALRDLGNRYAPQTEYIMNKGDSIVLEMEESEVPTRLYWYLGCYHNREFNLEYKNAPDADWTTASGYESFTMSDVFKWAYTELPAGSRYIRLTCSSDTASVMELALTDSTGTVFMPVNAPDYTLLFDEADMFSPDLSFRNGTYFDEIYHARTAYEYIHGLTPYENTHPPLGKIIMSFGIMLFGMTPFGWRIMGTLFGILMLPIIYLIGRNLTRSRILGGFACLLFAFDFMHFAQTRIATIDVYVTFFILLMYYFMYQYCRMSFYDTPLHKTLLPLGACGIFMGLGIASKWTGVYAAVGLAVLFFSTLYRRYREYRYAEAAPNASSNGISHSEVIYRFAPYTKKTILFCIVFFVLIPFIIYLLSYLPVVSGDQGLFTRMWNSQQHMFNYHSGLQAEHYYGSPWYQWPTMIKPIFYYSGTVDLELRQGISAFGNPLVWWVGIPAFCYMLYLIIKHKDRTAAWLCISYLAQYLPWCLVSRLTFIYHYFPSVPFVVLMIMYAAYKLKNRMSQKKFYLTLGLYSAGTIGLFLLFYPVLSGQTVSLNFVSQYLRWMDSWVLILK